MRDERLDDMNEGDWTMGRWDDYALEVAKALGPALARTDRWGRYVPEAGDEDAVALLSDTGEILTLPMPFKPGDEAPLGDRARDIHGLESNWRARFQDLFDILDHAPDLQQRRGPLGPLAPEDMLELRPGARRMHPRGFGPLDQEPRRVPMPYDRPEYRRLLPYVPAFPPDPMTLEYRPRRDDNRFFMWPANAPRRNQG